MYFPVSAFFTQPQVLVHKPNYFRSAIYSTIEYTLSIINVRDDYIGFALALIVVLTLIVVLAVIAILAVIATAVLDTVKIRGGGHQSRSCSCGGCFVGCLLSMEVATVIVQELAHEKEHRPCVEVLRNKRVLLPDL